MLCLDGREILLSDSISGVVPSKNASSLLQLNYNNQSIQAAMWQLASVDLIESYNKAEAEYYCVTKDLRSRSSLVKNEADGRKGDSASGDALAPKRAEFSYKAAFSPSASTNNVSNLLSEANLIESRVIVVHVNPDSGLTIFSVANSFGMMANSYVWIVIDWLPSVRDSSESTDVKNMNLLHGVLALSHHTPDSDHKNGFMTRCSLKYAGKWSINFYASYAYDFVWLAAHALTSFFNEGGNLSFSNDPALISSNGSSLNWTSLRMINGGQPLLKLLLSTNCMGIAG
ncbi:hypothetical protein Nepgr_003728 [Nepenthes gracilis]|uniref:Receptor ligand binding region domain-containing protein n=1 Tax=Nepenthes gracilis TaxID=150966 RepID=A0AAD3XE21_NEPGR|nr:hypothetical protein Nepgr_003728 [Nepenthes gracilis]